MILLLIFLLLILIFNTYQSKWNPIRPSFYPLGELIIIGHRGAPVLALENTLESFIKAFEADVNGIELDVQLSKDGELVVFHDWRLENITGSSYNIEDIDYSEIRDLSLINKCPIPLLNEVLDIFPRDKFINIEIKSKHYLNTELIEKLIQMIQISQIEKSVVVSSFNPFVLRSIKKMAPNLSTAFLWSSEDTTCLFNSPLWIWMCRPDGLHIDINNTDKKNVSWARNNNLAILAFTVNNSSDLSKALELGLDGIFSDDPHLITSSESS